MINSRFGCELVLLREATLEDIRKHEKRKTDKEDQKRIGYGMYWWIKYNDDGTESIADLAHLRADDGWKEIDNARRAIMGDKRYELALRCELK